MILYGVLYELRQLFCRHKDAWTKNGVKVCPDCGKLL